jgi:hypothetical protein
MNLGDLASFAGYSESHRRELQQEIILFRILRIAQILLNKNQYKLFQYLFTAT